ncbi:von Willebrand factor type A domain-containing protein [Mycena rosella]|uniref:von Willebrand factor type A domain-containing protein n=1 Tax=Mycena rosella TaxID=1033263 RepID=A0AAD7D6V3_MYCRO|nr:von Willebrand factor type A domain-containing protein [Mycena rosella]
MEQQTSDVFQVSVGKIPANEQVKIELVYATELSEDEENDSARFHLPVHIGARYGQAPAAVMTPSNNPFLVASASNTSFLTLAMSVEALAPISKIGCPSHAVSTELGPDPALPNFKDLPFANYARISLYSDSALDKDFVLTIKSAGLDAPRCVAELHPTHDTVALGLSLVPRFKLPDIARQEFVFLVDRSGSMEGGRIAAARKALVVMLRSLPHKDSLFQIISFGNDSRALWQGGSRPYNQETLEEATRHVDRMRADYGGTEIRSALQNCFDTRKLNRPTSVFLLTDGEAWDLDAVLDAVKTAVAAAPESAPLRVSVLGIGHSVSTAMCEGIARVGLGTCMLVGEKEASFTGKIARLLKAARTPPISSIFIDWGRPLAEVGKPQQPEDDFEMVEADGKKTEEADAPKKTLNIFDEAMDFDTTPPPPPPPLVVLSPPPAVQQSPFKVRNLSPGVRLNIYAILQGKSIPKTVTLRGSTADGAAIELPIPVTLSHLQNDPDGQHGLVVADPDDADLLARTVKASVVRLGKTYSISSTHTSFVAVDDGPTVLLRPAAPPPPPPSGRPPAPTGYIPPSCRGALPAPSARYAAPPPPSRSAPPPAPARRMASAQPDLSGYNYSAVSSLVVTAARASLASSGADRDRDRSRRGANVFGQVCKKKAPSVVPTDPLEALARIQSFDGCFSLDVLTFVILKTDLQAVRALFPAGTDDAVVATVLAMAFLARKLGADVERDSWEGMYEKAKDYVQEALGVEDLAAGGLEGEVAKMLA